MIKIDTYEIYNDDCFNILKTIPNNSVDCIICDPPYGQTPLEWDKELNFDMLWEEIVKVCKSTSPICIFAQEPFASKVRLSKLEWYKYDWYWKKERPTNIFQVKRRPAKYIENICVFYKEQCLYNPQKVDYFGPRIKNKPSGSFTKSVSVNELKVTPYEDDGTRYPCEILEFNRDLYYENLHETQKPVLLLEHLIKTYTNKGDIVLDMTMGSGSTGVACIKTGRKFIGIELNEEYFNTSKLRLEKYQKEANRRLF